MAPRITKILDGPSCLQAVRTLIATGKPVRAAVAYWGRGAIEQVGINTNSKMQIVCDVRSGGCNTEVVSDLIKLLGPENVKTHDQMHAKVWINDDTVIIGSSNVSANGLGFENSEVAGNTEVNIITTAIDEVMHTRDWYETVWEKARTISRNDMAVGAARRLLTRHSRSVPEDNDILQALLRDPASLSDRKLFVWVRRRLAADPWVPDELEWVKEDRQDEEIDYYSNVDFPFEPGSTIIDLEVYRNKVGAVGMYEVLKDRHIHKQRDGDGTLLLCRGVEKFQGTMPLGSEEMWRAAGQLTWLDEGEGIWTAPDFSTYLSRVPLGDKG